MAKNLYWLLIIVLSTSLLLLPSVNAEQLIKALVSGQQNFELRKQAEESSWTQDDIDAVFNLYGPTSAGAPIKATENNVPYEEIGVYGVEYENIDIDQFPKKVRPSSAHIMDPDDKEQLK